MRTSKPQRITQEDDPPDLASEPGKDEPLDLKGYETMRQTFGSGTNQRVVLVGSPITLNQLVEMSK